MKEAIIDLMVRLPWYFLILLIVCKVTKFLFPDNRRYEYAYAG